MSDLQAEFIDIELTRPLEIAGVAVKAMRMREPTVKDQMVASEVKGGPAQQEVRLIANLCDVSPADIERLPLRDYKRLQDAFLGFTV